MSEGQRWLCFQLLGVASVSGHAPFTATHLSTLLYPSGLFLYFENSTLLCFRWSTISSGNFPLAVL